MLNFVHYAHKSLKLMQLIYYKNVMFIYFGPKKLSHGNLETLFWEGFYLKICLLSIT